MAMILIFDKLVKATSAYQKYKENSFLDFPGNNAYANVPQCYKYTAAYLYFKVGTINWINCFVTCLIMRKPMAYFSKIV